ncbi:hypothetical protein IEQ34_015591 [Dendrobium chrysotoxum]|uniref:Fungal lipase-type domain-containing protein n=1 Tax=Dendrobium chrysotoxum TaxID=161865 RepID=A0AAV7GIK9_DENCH|nr:hypothetical protein IEQ34_015591 [Dendrobium chrysotoxum]
MAAKDEHMILRHDKARYRDIAGHLVLHRRLRGSKYEEHKSGVSETLDEARIDWVTALTLLIQKLLSVISFPLLCLGHTVEFFLNLHSLNGGFFGIFWGCLTVSLVIPRRKSADFRSIICHIDGRYELFRSIFLSDFPSIEPLPGLDVNPFSLSMMASKLAYENGAFIRNQVNKYWKMHFVRFFNCWNKYLKNRGTQAFICCDKEEDANVIVLAFRGTEPFNAYDWITDVDLSWLSMGKFGKAHLGFMRALGLQDEKDVEIGFPREHEGHDEGKLLAYYAIREELNQLLDKHKRAKIIITGHSLGGALAILFPAILAMHERHDIINRIHGVMTYGQPRVGDAVFGRNVQAVLKSKYHRMVYRYDIVPRIPFDKPPVALFKHFGTCIYFTSWYEGKVVEESPNPNYFHPFFVFSMYLNAVGDLTKAFLLAYLQNDFDEGFVSLMYRASGLFIPGLASHSPRDYVNGGTMAKIIAHKIINKEE